MLRVYSGLTPRTLVERSEVFYRNRMEHASPDNNPVTLFFLPSLSNSTTVILSNGTKRSAGLSQFVVTRLLFPIR